VALSTKAPKISLIASFRAINRKKRSDMEKKDQAPIEISFITLP
jgi:hypothetical protein